MKVKCAKLSCGLSTEVLIDGGGGGTPAVFTQILVKLYSYIIQLVRNVQTLMFLPPF